MVFIDDTATSTAITGESAVNLKWLQEAASPVVDWLKKPVASATNLGSKFVKKTVGV